MPVLPPPLPPPGRAAAPPSISVVGVAMLTFPSISGTVDFGGTAGPYGPDGQAVTAFTFGSFNGISGFSADRNTALFGVFTGSTEPANPAPPSLNFTGNTSFAALSPLLNQTFFIGDGLTGTTSGVPQEFVVPTGATQLYLGLADSGGSSEPFLPGGYFNNTGSFEVQVSPVPEPGSCLLVAVMASIGSIYLRRWRERPNQVLQQTAGA